MQKRGLFNSNFFWLTLVILAGAIFRLYHLDFQSLWGDELATWQDCWQPNFSQFWSTYLHYEVTPPLYFGLQYLIAQLAPASETSLRALSVLTGLGFVVACGLFAGELARDSVERRWASLAGSAFAAFSFRAILMSREARCYSQLFMLAAFLGWAWLRVRWMSQTLRESRAIPYVIFAGLICYTHYYGVLMVIAQACTVPLIAGFRDRRAWINAIAIYAATLVVFAPWLIFLLQHPPPVTAQVWPHPSLDKFFVAHRELFGSSSVSAIFSLVLTIVGGVVAPKELRRKVIAVFSWVILVFVLAAIVSQVKPVYSERYYMLVLAPALVVAAAGASRLANKRWLAISTIVLFCALGIHETVFARQIYSKPQNEQIRQATFAAFEDLQAKPDAKLAVFAFSPFVTDFYMEADGSTRRFSRSIVEDHDDLLKPDKWPSDFQGAQDLIALVFTYDDQDFARLFSQSIPGYRVVKHQDFYHVSTVLLEKTNSTDSRSESHGSTSSL